MKGIATVNLWIGLGLVGPNERIANTQPKRFSVHDSHVQDNTNLADKTTPEGATEDTWSLGIPYPARASHINHAVFGAFFRLHKSMLRSIRFVLGPKVQYRNAAIHTSQSFHRPHL